MNSQAPGQFRSDPPDAAVAGTAPTLTPGGRPTRAATWGWFIAKNVIGWLLILAAFVAGPLVPGPGGIPLFLIGFGMVTFPGKRRLTARTLRGVPFQPGTPAYRRGAALLALILPAALIVYLTIGWHMFRGLRAPTSLALEGFYVGAALLTWVIALRSVGLLNRLMQIVPRIRRKMRPWLRRHGIDLLPPRHRRRKNVGKANIESEEADEEILQIHERHRDRASALWKNGKTWARRVGGLAITVAIFVWILKPIVRQWDMVRDRVWAMNWTSVLAASVIFAAFLFIFRALIWRRIIKGLGNRLPVMAATRIWSTSELARYLPGVIWQVVGRAYLSKPYGVSGSVCSTSQILELAVFLLANLIMAVCCLAFLGKHVHGLARIWLIVAGALVPVLFVLVHPKIFYRLVNGVMKRIGKPPIDQRLRFRELLRLLAWSIFGLTWQGLAIWLVVHELLGLQLAKWWVVTGAYCLAWCAGFLAVWAPGGLGVREAVFIAAMEFALPLAVRHGQLGNDQQRVLFLIFLSILLRIWATAGELILAGIAYLLDFRGALGRADAPGVVPRSGRLSARAAS